MAFLLFAAVCFLAYSNGANDNFKGVASLFGSGTTRYKTAIAWATATTFAGSLAAIFLAQTLLRKFSGKGLVPEELVGSESFLLAVAAGAGATVILATLTGFPISTTHALAGAMAGSGLVAVGGEVNLRVLGSAFFLPLLVSPLFAFLLGAAIYFSFHWLRLRRGVTKEWCICIGEEVNVIPIPQPCSALAVAVEPTPLAVHAGPSAECAERYVGRFLGVGSQQVMDAAHFASAGVVSFARGLNDTPKMAALLLVLPAFGAEWSLLAAALAIAVGGLVSARRVAETMSHKLTAMNHGQGFSANLTTGILVIGASLFGLPVSTTHVSVGALLGIGVTSRRADLRVARNVLLSWIVTLPCAALLGGAGYGLLRLCGAAAP